MIIVTNVLTSINDKSDYAINKAIEIAKIPYKNILESFIIKTSIDARHGKMPVFVSSVGFYTNLNEESFVQKFKNKNITFRKNDFALPKIIKGKTKLKNRPIIVGFGPAGMFAGLILAQNGYEPVIIERGEDVDNRVKSVNNFWKNGVLNEKSNVQFGEGGAGTFSDGKLTTRINDPLCEYILKEFVRFGAPDEILKKAKPHIGTDKLRNIIKEIKKEIISLGGSVFTSTQMTDIIIKNGNVDSIIAGTNSLPCQALVLAIGHSARDTFNLLFEKNMAVETKPFSIGVRIEHLQSDIDAGLYGKYAGHPMLPKGEYQLSLRENGRAVYTFCMCPGGFVVPSSSEKATVVTNGMSEFSRDGKNANSALVVSVSQKDFGSNPWDAIEFQRKYEKLAFLSGGENYCAPAQTVGDFLNKKDCLNINRVNPSYSLGVKACDFNAVFSKPISDMLELGLNDFGRKIRGFNAPDAVLTGIETRTSSPVRILRDENHQSISVKGVYPCGEGAGYAGGIMSAAVDGVKTAISIMQSFSPSK